MSNVTRYIIVLDRYDDDDYVNVKSDGYHGEARSNAEGMEQVARELQEAMNETGSPAGFFRVVARTMLDENDDATAIATPDEQAHRAAMQALETTRNY